jgi:hypothetical protein
LFGFAAVQLLFNQNNLIPAQMTDNPLSLHDLQQHERMWVKGRPRRPNRSKSNFYREFLK